MIGDSKNKKKDMNKEELIIDQEDLIKDYIDSFRKYRTFIDEFEKVLLKDRNYELIKKFDELKQRYNM